MNALSRPHIPAGPEPSRDHDPTGVRDLLSALPEPEPMPAHLVQRINASLAAEQARRATQASGSSVAPLLVAAQGRRTQGRPARLLFAIAGMAAAVVLLAVVGGNLLTTHQGAATTTSGASASLRVAADKAAGNEGTRTAQRTQSTNAPQSTRGTLGNKSTPGTPGITTDKTPAFAARAPSPSVVQIGLSRTRYTQAGFVTQARALRRAPLQPVPAVSSDVGPAGTASGLRECLHAMGVTGAQLVRADVAFYEGAPAVIMVVTASGVSTAYAVGRQCSSTDTVVLRPATPLL